MTGDASIHATCVAFDGKAVLIRGASGTGKSAIGLMLMAMGCRLVSDDRTLLRRDGANVIASCPAPIRDMIEARGIGLLKADSLDAAEIVLVADLDLEIQDRLPQRRTVTLLGCEIPLIGHIQGPHLAPAILQILKAGWSDA